MGMAYIGVAAVVGVETMSDIANVADYHQGTKRIGCDEEKDETKVSQNLSLTHSIPEYICGDRALRSLWHRLLECLRAASIMVKISSNLMRNRPSGGTR